MQTLLHSLLGTRRHLFASASCRMSPHCSLTGSAKSSEHIWCLRISCFGLTVPRSESFPSPLFPCKFHSSFVVPPSFSSSPPTTFIDLCPPLYPIMWIEWSCITVIMIIMKTWFSKCPIFPFTICITICITSSKSRDLSHLLVPYAVGIPP